MDVGSFIGPSDVLDDLALVALRHVVSVLGVCSMPDSRVGRWCILIDSLCFMSLFCSVIYT